MIIEKILNSFKNEEPPPVTPSTPGFISYDFSGGYARSSTSGKIVTPEAAKRIATAYRCGNILSDDVASLPFQMFQQIGNEIRRVAPENMTRNIPYLLEIQPNRWMTPFLFKRTVIMWLLYWGDAYVWYPPSSYNELFILPASTTHPWFDESGNLWFKTIFPNGKQETLPAVEVLHLMINSIDGIVGRSVLSYARDTIGRQMGAHETQDRIAGKGLNPTAALYMAGEVSEEARTKAKDAYIKAVDETGVAVFDNKVSKFETVTMKPVDVQFLETVGATDIEIANFFGMPAYKLNMGKQSYESNSQQDLDYLKSTLNPYLISWEQAARINWVSALEQVFTYFKFNREALLQTSAKDRAQYLKDQIMSGQMSPNEARQINDQSPYAGGDGHYIPANMAMVNDDGTLASTTGVSNPPDPQQK